MLSSQYVQSQSPWVQTATYPHRNLRNTYHVTNYPCPKDFRPIVNVANDRYRALIGTGGIGSGMFFALDGNHTLGREESRSGHFLDRRDYCKLHIVSHYVRRLLGAAFPVIPLGMVGADEVGDRLLAEMAEVGLDLRYVGRAEGRRTLYALCLIYPDGSGGNVTENDSACAAVDAGWIARAEAEFARFCRPRDRSGAARGAPGRPPGAAGAGHGPRLPAGRILHHGRDPGAGRRVG